MGSDRVPLKLTEAHGGSGRSPAGWGPSHCQCKHAYTGALETIRRCTCSTRVPILLGQPQNSGKGTHSYMYLIV